MSRRPLEPDVPPEHVTRPAPAVPSDDPFAPYVPPTSSLPELTPLAVVLGVLLSLTFGMVNAYLGLKVGITVSASIPSAVLSMTILRGLLRRGTILENNVVHTVASAGESLAAGTIFTVPALIFLDLAPTPLEIAAIGAGAGLLGILMMIPLRHSLTIDEHRTLPFPEGTACAQVLIAGDRGGSSARPVLSGIALGAGYQFLMRGLSLWRESTTVTVAALHKATIGVELSPIFLGVGWLVGVRIAATMLAGGVLAWSILIPLFDASGGSRLGDLLGVPAAVGALSAHEIWSGYVRYVGAGAVTAGGLFAIIRALPVMAAVLRRLRPNVARSPAVARTDRDLPPIVVVCGVAALAVLFATLPIYRLSPVAAVLAVVLAFFFVVVSGRIVGLVGTTSQPVSGMTITAVLATSFILVALGERGAAGMAASITAGAIVAIAVSLAGDLAQDLKTGALVGATPWKLQLGEMVGAVAAALRAGSVLFLLHAAYTLGSPQLPAPQARLMATLVTGVMHGDLPWALMLLGAALAVVAEIAGVVSLAFAIGLYLPITTTAPLIFGGLLRAALERRRTPVGDAPTLFASGLIAGDALMGIGIAVLIVTGLADSLALRRLGAEGSLGEALLTALPFVALAAILARHASRDA